MKVQDFKVSEAIESLFHLINSLNSIPPVSQDKYVKNHRQNRDTKI